MTHHSASGERGYQPAAFGSLARMHVCWRELQWMWKTGFAASSREHQAGSPALP